MYDTSNFNVHSEYQGLPYDNIVQINNAARLPYAVCTINLNGDLNTGIIIRTANIMGAERVIVFGRRKYDRRSTVGSHKYIDIKQVEGFDGEDLSPEKFIRAMNEFDYVPVMIETGGEYIEKINDHISYVMNVLGKKICLVFGNEGVGIQESILSLGKQFSIAQRGVIRSLNVSSAASIALWETQKVFS